MKKNMYDGKRVANILISFMVNLFKWLSFILTVCSLGLTIGILVVYISKHSNIGSDFVISVYCILTKTSSTTPLNLIKEVGIDSTVFVTIAHGINLVIIYGITYVVMDTVRAIYKAIKNKTMFTVENIKKIDSLIYLTIILAISPVIIGRVILSSTNGIDDMPVNLGGLVYFCIAYVAKLIFVYGYELEHKVELISLEEKKLVKKVTEKKKKELSTKKEIKKETKKTNSVKKNQNYKKKNSKARK